MTKVLISGRCTEVRLLLAYRGRFGLTRYIQWGINEMYPLCSGIGLKSSCKEASTQGICKPA